MVAVAAAGQVKEVKMKSLRFVLVVAVALAAASAAPSGAQQKGQQKESAAPDTAKPLQDVPAQDALRQMFSDLAAENVKLRKENKELRADNDALKGKLQESEQLLRRWRANRGTMVVPPQAPQGQPDNTVPKNWQPFEFNGATYYVVPLKADQEGDRTSTNTLMQVVPARPAPPAK